MTIIKPFKGILYNRPAVGNLNKVITPPYDVITPQRQAYYYGVHPNNFIRIDLGKTSAKDSASNNRYTRARGFFERWLNEGVLLRDTDASIYIYEQQYADEGEQRSRLGFICLARLEDDRTKGFIPHERTFSGPKEDRFKLMKAVMANTSPIFSIVFDEQEIITRLLKNFAAGHKPAIDVRFEGVRNKLWRVSEGALTQRISRLMRDRKALIADGHHRYEVALEFRRAMKKLKASSSENYDYVMMYFAPAGRKGLTILPTHRMVEDISSCMFIKNMVKTRKVFDIITAGGKGKMFSLMRENRRGSLGVYLGGREYFCLSLKAKDAGSIIRSNHSGYWKNLDVVILHKLFLERIFGIRGKAAEEAVHFTRDPKTAFDWVDAGRNRAAFFLNPPLLEEIRNIVKNNERMPHKTTYFYPKPVSGLVMNKLE